MEMSIKCGEYEHFKGKHYTVYGVATTNKNEKFVLYQQNYGSKTFWIRRLSMFLEEVEYNGKKVKRFKLLKDVSLEKSIANIVSELKDKNIVLFHSETEQKYRILRIITKTKEMIIAPYESHSSYLTDTQMALRMGYDLYKIDNTNYIHTTTINIPTNKKLIIKKENTSDIEYENKKIIEDMNPCSIDLHISDHFFSKAKRKTIDIASMMHFSVKASELWKEIRLKKRNGFDSIVIRPGQTIITHTLEQIELPSDCAGKIEIKSTYARLALSITASDFCNPGWKGYFPLTITNNGKHKIILHPKEKMLQLSLVQTDGQIVNEYSQKATYMNDDGTPFKFWHAQTVKHLQKELYSDEILEFYEKVLTSINSKNSENPDETKTRFEDTFLLFCEKKLKNEKYNSVRNPKELLKKIWNMYRRKESTHKLLMGKFFKLLALGITLLPTSITCIVNLFINSKLSSTLIVFLIASIVLAVVIEIVMHIFTPNCFCTFEKLEFDNIYKKHK